MAIATDPPRLSRSRALECALLIVLAAIAVVRWLHLVQHVRSYYVDLPTWDYWRVVEDLAGYRAGNWKVLWRQHNEHRIVLPELVFAADMLWFRGRKIFSIVMSLACYFGTLLILAGSVFWDAEMRTSLRLAAFLLAAITLGWMGGAIVIGDAFLLQWTMLHFWIVLSLLLLSVAQTRSSQSILAASLVCACAATYTSGNGMLIWPVLLAAAVLLRLHKLELLSIVLCGGASIGIYFAGYKFVGHLGFLHLITNFACSLGFIGSYLGMPFAANRSRSFGVAAGWVGILLFVFLFWMAVRKGLVRARPVIVLFGVFAFTLLSAVLAAAGRMDPMDRSFVLAKQARYVTTPLVNWTALVVFCVWLGSRDARRPWMNWRVPGVIALALLLGFRHLSSWVHARDAEVADLQLGALGVQAGLLDDPVLKKFFPDPEFVRAYLPELKAGRLSIYSEDQTNWIGQDLGVTSGALLPPQSGSIRYQRALPSGTELGLAIAGDRIPEWLVFLNPANVIVGIGRRLPAAVPFVVETEMKSEMKGKQAMFAFVKGPWAVSSLRAYLANDTDHAPRLSNAIRW